MLHAAAIHLITRRITFMFILSKPKPRSPAGGLPEYHTRDRLKTPIKDC